MRSGESGERSAVAVLSNRWLIQLGTECLWLFKVNTGLVCILRYGPLCSCRPNHVFAITISPSAARRASRWLGSCENNTKTLFGRPIGIGVQLSSAFGSVIFKKNVSNFLRSGRLFRMFHHSLTQFCVPRILTWESGPLRHNTKGFHGFWLVCYINDSAD